MPSPSHAPESPGIDRAATGVRILLTLLFALVIRVVEAVLAVVVIFQLAATLVTGQPPGPAVRDFANRVCVYLYRVTRFLTYNDADPPFPFSDWPEALEPPTEAYADGERAAPHARA